MALRRARSAVNTFPHVVNGAIGAPQLKADLRVAFEEVADLWGKDQPAHGHRHVHAKLARHRAG